MITKKVESGRSMVEMLGVLAIVGVLSLTGIVAYTISMRIHRENTIMDIMRKIALYSISANAGNGQQMVFASNDTTTTMMGASHKVDKIGYDDMPEEVLFMVASGDSKNQNAVLTFFATDQKDICENLASKLSHNLVKSTFGSTSYDKSNCQGGISSPDFISVKFN